MSSRPEPVEDGVPMSFLDNLKKKAEELDLETRAKQLQEAATQAAKQAREKAGHFAAQNREKIDGYVETATTKIDEKTEGKYADKVAKVREQVGRGVDKVAEGHTSGRRRCTRAVSTRLPATCPSRPGRRWPTRPWRTPCSGSTTCPRHPPGTRTRPPPRTPTRDRAGLEPPHDGTN